jgi:predicted PurR-regulated permease PerM
VTRASSERPHPTHRSPLEQLGSVALIFFAAGGIAAVLYVGRDVFVPIAFALLFALILSSPVEALYRRGVARGLAGVLMLLVMLLVVGATLRLVWSPARQWIASIPHTVQVLEHTFGPVAKALERRLAGDSPVAPSGAHPTPLMEQVEVSASDMVLVATPGVAADAVTIVILTLFLVTGGAPMAARLACTLISSRKSTKALHVIEAVRSEIARYYATVALINLGLGAATALMTLLLGLPNPLLWGTLAGVLNFVPYIGSTVTLLVLAIVATVTFTSLAHVLAVAASFLLLVTIEGQVVEPLLLGRRLKLSPTAVLLAFWFGGWFWGIPGIVLVMPLLLALKVVAEHVPNGRIVVELLSPLPRQHFRLARKELHGARRAAGRHAGEAPRSADHALHQPPADGSGSMRS